MPIQTRFATDVEGNGSTVYLISDGVEFADVSNRTGHKFEISLYNAKGLTFSLDEFLQAVEQAVLELGGNPERLRDSLGLRVFARIDWLKLPPTTCPWRAKARFLQEEASTLMRGPWSIVVMPFDVVYQDKEETKGWVYYNVVEAGTHFIEPGTSFEVLEGDSVVGVGIRL